MGCNCGGRKSAVKYQVTMSDKTVLPDTYTTAADAQKAGASHAKESGLTFTYRAVPA
jgi:hypothetical protein